MITKAVGSLQTAAVLFCSVLLCFVFCVFFFLIYTNQLQIHLYNLKKLLVPVNPPTMPCIFSRVSVPPWRRRFVTAPPLPPFLLLHFNAAVRWRRWWSGGEPEMFTAFHAHDSHFAGKTPSPRPGFELARGQKSVFHDNFQVRGRDGESGKCCRCVFFFSFTPPPTERNPL